MPTLVASPFTDQQLVDIRRFCGFMAYGTGNVLFPFPWVNKYYLALEYRMVSLTADEVNTVVNIILANLYTLELAIPNASSNLSTDAAGPWVHNKREVRDRVDLFNYWRRYLCDFLGVPYGPGLAGSGGANRQLVV